MKLKITPNASKNESGLTQMIMMGKSIRYVWVSYMYHVYLLSPYFQDSFSIADPPIWMDLKNGNGPYFGP